MAMNGSYFDIDDILAINRKVSCVVADDVSTEFLTLIGQQQHVLPEEQISRNARQKTIEVPIWLIEAILARDSQFAPVELPREYKDSYRQVLEADAVSVDLNRIGPYFYLTGSKLAAISPTEGRQLASTLLQTFINRIGWLMSRSQYSNNDQRPSNLDKFESVLYDLGMKSEVDFDRWINSRSTTKRKYDQTTGFMITS